MIATLVFAVAYALKGGWLSMIPSVAKAEATNRIAETLFEGRTLSFILVFIFGSAASFDLAHGAILTLVWASAVTPSMGEEAGAIGRMGYWWGKYKDMGFTRSYGIKKALQRGVFMGAVFAITFGHANVFIPIIGLGFVAAHFIMQELYFRIHKFDSWAYAEPVVGALIGLSYAISQ